MKCGLLTSEMQFYRFIVIPLLFRTVSTQDIRLPPDVVQDPETLKVYKPNKINLELQCLSSGYPPPSLEWKKNNQALGINSDNIQVIDDGRIITIKQANTDDEGQYQCFANNQYGKAMSDVVTLQMASLAEFPDTDTKNYGKSEGQPFSLGCNNAPLSVPRATISWHSVTDPKDDFPKKIETSRRMQIDDKGNLLFAFLEKSDELPNRLYKCNVFNSFADVGRGGSYSKIYVNETSSAPDFAPSVFLFPDTVVGLASANVSLRCFFQSKPELDSDISWSRDDGGAWPDGRAETRNFGSELIIKNLVPSDAGNYVCQGKNRLGIGQKIINLKIESAPIFSSMSDRVHNRNVTDGDTVLMRCAAQADPEATVTWYQNTVQFDSNTLPRGYSLSKDGLNLTISGLCKKCNTSSLSVIQCRATNKHGSAFSQGYINVLAATKILDKSENFIFKESIEVIFPCSATGDDSVTLAYTWYFIRSGTTNVERIVYDNNVYFNSTNSALHIKTQNDTDKGLGRVGEYICEVSAGDYSKTSLSHFYINPSQNLQASANLWWIAVIVAILLLVLLIIILCYVCVQRNKGDSYLVDEKERGNGNDPEEELLKDGFHDYQRPEGAHIYTADHGSINGSIGNTFNEDDSSLNAYAMSDPGKFKEDGSFIGQYNTTRSGKEAPADLYESVR